MFAMLHHKPASVPLSRVLDALESTDAPILAHGDSDPPPLDPPDYDGDKPEDDDHSARRMFYPPSRDRLPAGAAIQCGQYVYSALYGGRYGIVYKIDGEQSPESVRTMCGVIATGGRAHLSVIFDNGSRSPMIPECIVRGVQWEIYAHVASPDTIMDGLDYVKRTEAARDAQAVADNARRQAERARYAAENPHLVQASAKPDWSPGRLAAENIRRELKREFPGVKFKVRSDHNSVDIYWTDGPTTEQVETVTGKYRAGSFDGMTDCYEYDPDATWGDVFGDPRYTFTHRTDTVDGVREAWKRDGRDPAEVPDDSPRGWRDAVRPYTLGDDMFRTWSQTDLR